MNCSENQEYGVQSDCPRTCLHPDGDYECGDLTLTEGCFCKNGFVMDSEGNCIKADQCGCTFPDGSGVLQVVFSRILI